MIDNPTIALRNIERFAEMESKSRSTSMAQVSLPSPICGNCQARELKIDKMLVQNLTNSQRDALLVKSSDIHSAHSEVS